MMMMKRDTATNKKLGSFSPGYAEPVRRIGYILLSLALCFLVHLLKELATYVIISFLFLVDVYIANGLLHNAAKRCPATTTAVKCKEF